MKEETVIAICNSKGGAGKSTTALNLGAALSATEKKVLLIDSDVQGNLTAALGFTQGEQKIRLRSCCWLPSTHRRMWNCICPGRSCIRKAGLT